MSHLPIAPPGFLPASRQRMSAQAPEDIDEESLNMVKSYLQCRSRCIDPDPPLVEAWNDFYDTYAPRIRKFIGHWRLADEDQSDCFQDVWKEVIVNLAHFRRDPTRGCLATWLMTLARNKAVDSIRRRSRQCSESLGDATAIGVVDPAPDPAAAHERRRTTDDVRSALDRLSRLVSPTSFQVLYLRYMEGRPTAEVAAVLALTPEQVRFRTCRMKRKVRELLERSHESGVRDRDRRVQDNIIDFGRNATVPSNE